MNESRFIHEHVVRHDSSSELLIQENEGVYFGVETHTYIHTCTRTHAISIRTHIRTCTDTDTDIDIDTDMDYT